MSSEPHVAGPVSPKQPEPCSRSWMGAHRDVNLTHAFKSNGHIECSACLMGKFIRGGAAAGRELTTVGAGHVTRHYGTGPTFHRREQRVGVGGAQRKWSECSGWVSRCVGGKHTKIRCLRPKISVSEPDSRIAPAQRKQRKHNRRLLLA